MPPRLVPCHQDCRPYIAVPVADESEVPYSLRIKVRRSCKLDPNLKASSFQILIVEKDNGAFNLEPGF